MSVFTTKVETGMAAPPEAGSTQDVARPAEEVYGATKTAKPSNPQKVMGSLV